MTKKIFRSIFFSALAMFLGTVLLFMGYLYHYFTQLELDQLQAQTSLVTQAVNQEGEDYLSIWAQAGTRVTWIGADGQVLFDSETAASQMENHANREEVREALASGQGESVRYSSTLTQQLLYTAQALPDGSVIRLAQSQETVLFLLWQMVPWLSLLFVLSVLASLVLARLTAGKLLRPLEELDLERPLANDVYVELHPLLKRLDQHQQDLVEKEGLLQQKTTEFDTIIAKMKEGLVLLDREGRLLSYNAAACQILQLDQTAIGRPLSHLQRQPSLKGLLDQTLSGKKKQAMLTLAAASYKVLGRPIWSDGQQTGAVLLFFDETEQQALETMRREFTANVSHELRTPLQIMTGYSELLQTQELSEQALLFSQKIDKEAKRMMTLVEDILYLSQLDEVTEISKEKVELTGLLRDIVLGLEDKAREREVSLSLSGPVAMIEGNRGILHSVLYNLCDNAIKYNRPAGSVKIVVEELAEGVEVRIADTGIGISQADQDRIFERFYRADKSRSKKVGGTGLGLSIVKHGLQLHDATIAVSSQLGEGTTMRLVFPKTSKKSMN